VIIRRKTVRFCEGAEEEFYELSRGVRKKFKALILKLETEGRLSEPDAKKLTNFGIFEIRIREEGQWRGLYVYSLENQIFILRIFQKKTQKTPLKEIKIALKRLSNL
jgi:phage-related protein